MSARGPRTRLADLGSEVSSSLEDARQQRGAAARVREKLVAREIPRLRAEWRSDSGGLRGRLHDARFAAVASTQAWVDAVKDRVALAQDNIPASFARGRAAARP